MLHNRKLCNLLFMLSGGLYWSIPVCSQTAPCDVVQVIPYPGVHRVWSPDSARYLENRQDSADIFQIYVGNAGDTLPVCISETGPWGLLRPWVQRNKLQVQWHSSGRWIICGVEKEYYNELLYVPYPLRLGWLQSGIWMEIWAVKPDGSSWTQLAVTEGGFTGPAFTPDGMTCAWAEALDSSNFAVDVFGRWKLWRSDFAEQNGVPSFTHTTDIQPAGARWIEPGNFGPDGRSLLISSDIGMSNAEGQDQYVLDVISSEIINLTNSPMIWDEHGVFSPDGRKILFMSSYPYRDDTTSYRTLSIKAEFMLMNADGSGLQQLTHFRDTGYVESSEGIAATGFWSRDGSRIYAQSLIFPDYENWIIEFAGHCGNDDLTQLNDLSDGNFRLYPNPAYDRAFIETDRELSHVSVFILSITGQVVDHCTALAGSRIQLEVGDLETGVYIVQLQSDRQLKSWKLIKY